MIRMVMTAATLAATVTATLALPAGAQPAGAQGAGAPPPAAATPPATGSVAPTPAPAASPPAAAGLPDDAPLGQRLIFAPRDYAAAAAAAGLGWRLDREGRAAEGFTPLAGGRLALVPVTDPADGRPLLELREDGGGRSRVVGRYPPAGMDPVLVYFLETATRNVAALGQGNPDYIRNRFKDALRRGGEVSPRDGGGQRVQLRPFAGDPNAAKMHGLDVLVLSFDLAPEPGQPIAAMTAESPGYALRLTQAGAP